MKNLILVTIFLNLVLNVSAKDFTGLYEVPTDDQTLKEFALFDMEENSISFEEGKKLEYKLPASMMTDKAQMMKFDFNQATNTFESEHGEGVCRSLENGLVRCDMVYSEAYGNIIRGVNPLMPDFLETQIGLKGDALSNTLKVLDGFAQDPIGILFIKLK